MSSPVGEDSWIDFVEQQSRGAHDLESRRHVLEHFRHAVSAEPGSIKVWTAYCEYFWSLYVDSQPGSEAGWSPKEQGAFSLDEALNLWQQGYEAVKFRLNDSHELWNRWIELEMELLERTRTEQGVKRITHLFKNRLNVPHATWDETSQKFSTFLSSYNRNAYEQEMKQITESSRNARMHYEPRAPFELRLRAAEKESRADEMKRIMLEYLDWEMGQFRDRVKHRSDPVLTFETCLGLYARALTGLFATDESTWINHIVFLSSVHSSIKEGWVKNQTVIDIVPNILDTLRRAVLHVPWSGTAWARYILSGEEAGLAFSDMESIKHAATNSSELDKDGMSAVLEMYSAWCGYLKRRAMDPNASEEAVDLAEIGLPSALEDVQHWGKRRYGDAYQGDPNYRLEKIYIQFLTEKKDAVEEARRLWEQMSEKALHANSYDFWLNYYLWEMVVFGSSKSKMRSPTPATLAQGLRVPSHATRVFVRALKRKTIDWPERIMEVYLQHCNDYELPYTLRQALDTVHKTRRSVAARREKEAREAAAAQAAYAQAVQTTQDYSGQDEQRDSPSGKRKREESPGRDAGEVTTKRAKNEAEQSTEAASAATAQALKRDRENTSVFVENLPSGTTATAVRKYFREYGHINNLVPKHESDSFLVEFRSPEEAQSALLRDGKYFGTEQISVRPATGCTIYVTNYPPEADEAYIRKLFAGCGDIFDLRLPNLQVNTMRRFCYITFRNSEAAAKATKLDGKKLEGKYKLVAKYSDPTARQHRSGATAEEREVHVQNLHFETTEDELRKMFSHHGNVQSVRILRNMAGRSTGTAFVDMETKEQAKAAVAGLDKCNCRGRTITVEVSKPKYFKPKAVLRNTASPSPAPSGQDGEGDQVMHDAPNGSSEPGQGQGTPPSRDIADRTVALLGIPSTVNVARVRAMVEPHGDIVKLALHPIHGGAVVEFRDKAQAGRASLALEGKEIAEGKTIRIGTVAELFQEKSAATIDRIDIKPTASKTSKDSALMPPPPTIRRNLGTRGGKRGGLVVPTSRKAIVTAPPTANGGDAAPAKKSNADFKKMFLGASANAGASNGGDASN
ncbi:Splicing factor [Coniochaeta pulveracea]|uniref:U4/U6 snRNA-associated-splicing factor PRP24 n=1 Tax=Coniochaeta pulveracea TaxID=177199 RepID=A0A420YNM6_9PEZI|nr:Splicing factor [Coniochaeta pulveracea]